MRCPSCGAENRDGAPFCLTCRATISAPDASAERAAPASVQPSWATPYVDHQIEPDPDQKLAGFWNRAFALILDTIFIFLLAIPLQIGLSALGARLIVALILPVALVSLLYQVIMTAHGGGWGMRIMHIRIVRVDGGGRPGYGRAFARVIARGVLGIVPIIGNLIQVVDHLWMIWDRDKQTWHDKAARTIVIES